MHKHEITEAQRFPGVFRRLLFSYAFAHLVGLCAGIAAAGAVGCDSSDGLLAVDEGRRGLD